MARGPRNLDQCFTQGADARRDRRKLADNPYDIETDEHREWVAGWSATLDLDEDQDAASTRIGVGDTDRTDTGDDREPEPPNGRCR